MVRAAGWIAGTVIVALASAVSPVHAFWPLPVPEAKEDSAAVARRTSRWEAFRLGKAAPAAAVVVDSPATADSLARLGSEPAEAPPPPVDPAALAAAAAAGATLGGALAETTIVAADTLLAGGAAAVTGTMPGEPIDPTVDGAAAAAAAAAAAGGGTTTTTGTAPLPSTLQALAAQRGWTPEMTSRFQSDNDNLMGSAEVRSTFLDVSGITLTNTLGTDKTINKLRDDILESHRLTNLLSIPLAESGLSFNLSTTNTRSSLDAGPRNNAVSQRQTDNRGGQAALKLSRQVNRLPIVGRRVGYLARGIGINGFYGYDVSSSSNDQGTARTPGASSNQRRGSGSSYGAGVTFDRLRWISVRARIGSLRRQSDDQTRQFVTSDSIIRRDSDSKGEGDTTTVDITIPARGIVQSITVGLRDARGDDTAPEQATGSSGQITGTGFQFETTTFRSRTLNLGATLRPMSRLNTVVTLGVSRDSTNYRIKRLQFSDNERFNLKVDNRLTFWKGAQWGVIFEANSADINRDIFIDSLETNPLTHEDRQRRLFTEFSKPLTSTWSMKLYGEVKLDQGFYVHPVPNQGKSDLDQFRAEIGGQMSGNLSANTTGGVVAYIRMYNQAFIDRRRSAASKDETEYVVRPNYVWRITEQVTLRQNYGLESKVIEPIFDPQSSTLARKHYATTGMSYIPVPRLTLDAAYDFSLQDAGKYIPIAGREGRFFARDQRSKRDQVNVGAHYTVISGGKLVFSTVQTKNRILTSFGSAPARVTKQGTLRIGFTSSLKVGEFKLDAKMFRFQNINATLDADVVWNGDATLVWTF